ncbi:MAG TPA: serine/threonine-protein kinase [Planctomycetota bacterium]|nr:serine/threonine-protein kinase [Planctomycetota bacterium]
MEAPRALGPYRLIRELGHGEFGSVHEAEDPRLARTVAIKVFPQLPRGDPKLERFLREAKTQARVAHPNVVRVFDAGFDRGVPYLVLELVRGESLRALLRRSGKLEPARALEIAAQVARGVQAVHEAGLVHRDLKPENILLDEVGVPRVADFGIVREVMAETLTQTGGFLGTPEYMAPEQAASRRDEIGPATDVWALGCVLQELVSGKTPFGYATDMIGLLGAIETRPPGQLPTSTPTERAVRDIVAKSLAKKPEDRLPSAAAFEQACREALEVEAPTSRLGGKWGLRLLALMLGVAIAATSRLVTRPPPPVHAVTVRELLDRARAGESAEDLCRQPCAEQDAVTLESGFRNHDPALGLLVQGKLEEARAAAVPSTALGDLIRREAPAATLDVTLVPVAVISHGVASTARVVVGGEAIFATSLVGGPVRTFASDGKLVGFATREPSASSRALATRGPEAAWTTSRGIEVAYTGVVQEIPLPGARAVALGQDGTVWGATADKIVQWTASTQRSVVIPFPLEAMAALDGGVVALGPRGGVLVSANLELELFAATAGPLDARSGEALFVNGDDLMAVKNREFRKIPLAGSGRVSAILIISANEIAIARGTTLEIVDHEGHGLVAPEPLGDDAVSLAALDARRLVVGLRRRPARIYERANDRLSLVAELEPGEETVVAATLDDHGHVTTTGWDGATRTFEIATRKLVTEELRDSSPVSRNQESGMRTLSPALARRHPLALALSPDGKLAAIIDESGLSLLTLAGDPVAHAPSITLPPVAWSHDGTHIVAGSGPVSVFLVRR